MLELKKECREVRERVNELEEGIPGTFPAPASSISVPEHIQSLHINFIAARKERSRSVSALPSERFQRHSRPGYCSFQSQPNIEVEVYFKYLLHIILYRIQFGSTKSIISSKLGHVIYANASLIFLYSGHAVTAAP